MLLEEDPVFPFKCEAHTSAMHTWGFQQAQHHQQCISFVFNAGRHGKVLSQQAVFLNTVFSIISKWFFCVAKRKEGAALDKASFLPVDKGRTGSRCHHLRQCAGRLNPLDPKNNLEN